MQNSFNTQQTLTNEVINSNLWEEENIKQNKLLIQSQIEYGQSQFSQENMKKVQQSQLNKDPMDLWGQQLLGEDQKKFEDYLIQYELKKKNYLDKFIPNYSKSLRICKNCNKKEQIENNIILSNWQCKDLICKDCLKQMIQKQLEINPNIDQFYCPICQNQEQKLSIIQIFNLFPNNAREIKEHFDSFIKQIQSTQNKKIEQLILEKKPFQKPTEHSQKIKIKLKQYSFEDQNPKQFQSQLNIDQSFDNISQENQLIKDMIQTSFIPKIDSNEKDIFKCNLCFSDKRITEKEQLNCGDYVLLFFNFACQDCINQWIQFKFDDKKGNLNFEDFGCIHQLNCRKGEVNQCLTKEQIKKYLSIEQQQKIQLYFEKSNMFQCPYQNCLQHLGKPQNKAQLIQCRYCFQYICGTCLLKLHPNKSCSQFQQDENSFAQLQRRIYNQNLGICPICLIQYPKDTGCDHVTCPNCKIEFCYDCSAPRHPTMQHGNHYHRKGCKWFTPWIDQRGKEILVDPSMKQDCKECLKIGSVCPRPCDMSDFFRQIQNKLHFSERTIQIKLIGRNLYK